MISFIIQKKTIMNISWTTVIIVILLIIIGYILWRALSSSSNTSTGTTKLVTPTTIVATSSTNSFTFSTWIAINTWGSGGNNLIKTPSATPTFALTLGSVTNDLNLAFTTTPATPSVIISNIVPLQTWASIIVSVNNGNSVDVYVNGKLVKTFPLNGVYLLPAGDVIVGGATGTSTGYISTTLDNKSIGPQDAWNIYSSGFGGGSGDDFFNKYKIRFAFVKDNVELSRFDI